MLLDTESLKNCRLLVFGRKRLIQNFFNLWKILCHFVFSQIFKNMAAFYLQTNRIVRILFRPPCARIAQPACWSAFAFSYASLVKISLWTQTRFSFFFSDGACQRFHFLSKQCQFSFEAQEDTESGQLFCHSQELENVHILSFTVAYSIIRSPRVCTTFPCTQFNYFLFPLQTRNNNRFKKRS